MAVVLEVQCDQCGKRVPTYGDVNGNEPRRPVKDWLAVHPSLGAPIGDFCSWGCVATYAAKQAAPEQATEATSSTSVRLQLPAYGALIRWPCRCCDEPGASTFCTHDACHPRNTA